LPQATDYDVILVVHIDRGGVECRAASLSVLQSGG
jgi:cobyric acid synthase